MLDFVVIPHICDVMLKQDLEFNLDYSSKRFLYEARGIYLIIKLSELRRSARVCELLRVMLPKSQDRR